MKKWWIKRRSGPCTHLALPCGSQFSVWMNSRGNEETAHIEIQLLRRHGSHMAAFFLAVRIRMSPGSHRRTSYSIDVLYAKVIAHQEEATTSGKMDSRGGQTKQAVWFPLEPAVKKQQQCTRLCERKWSTCLFACRSLETCGDALLCLRYSELSTCQITQDAMLMPSVTQIQWVWIRETEVWVTGHLEGGFAEYWSVDPMITLI